MLKSLMQVTIIEDKRNSLISTLGCDVTLISLANCLGSGSLRHELHRGRRPRFCVRHIHRPGAKPPQVDRRCTPHVLQMHFHVPHIA